MLLDLELVLLWACKRDGTLVLKRGALWVLVTAALWVVLLALQMGVEKALLWESLWDGQRAREMDEQRDRKLDMR